METSLLSRVSDFEWLSLRRRKTAVFQLAGKAEVHGFTVAQAKENAPRSPRAGING